MPSSFTPTDLDLVLFGAPLIFLTIVAYFRMDKILTASKAARTPRSIFAPESLRDRDSMYTDPDGRPWDEQ